jgi:hypothetical protein
MSASQCIYKINKYKSKLLLNPDNHIYKTKYNFYKEQIGGMLGALAEAAIRMGAFCRVESIKTAQTSQELARLKGLKPEAVVAETSSKLKTWYDKFVREVDKSIADGVNKGDIPTGINTLEKSLTKENLEEISQSLMNYAVSPACPSTGINITATGDDAIAKELARQLQPLASAADKMGSIIKKNISAATLPENALEKIRAIYLNLN